VNPLCESAPLGLKKAMLVPYVPPLSDDLLLANDFFNLYPLDGGGALVSPGIVSSIQDEDFAHEVLDGDAMRDFGKLPHLDFRRFERWRTAQKSCWLNRFYWLAPLAKRFVLTRDQDLAELIVRTMLYFIEVCPAPSNKTDALDHMRRVYDRRDNWYNRATYEEIQRDETDIEYIWFDFEPASRLLHWIYALHFLKKGGGIGTGDWEKIVASIYRHAEVIYWGEHGERTLTPRDNHQSLRGIALLHAAAFFKGVGQWKAFLEEGARLVAFHNREGFFPDGALKEISPSYHLFQMWHVRDALLLSRKYDFCLDSQLGPQLDRPAAYCRAVTDPGGKTVVINDGFPASTSAFLKSVEFLPEASHNAETEAFPDAGIAVLRRKKLFLLFDASTFTGRASHYHAGKNAFILWVASRPFFVDSGCCPYDDELFTTWYRRGAAHSSMMVDEHADGRLTGYCDFEFHASPQLSSWSPSLHNTQITSSKLTSTVPAWRGVTWTRTIEVTKEDDVVIFDRVESSREVMLSFVFNLHPEVSATLSNSQAILWNGPICLRLTWTSEKDSKAEIREGKYFLGAKHLVSRQVWVHLSGKGITEVTFTISQGNHNLSQ